MSKPQNAKDKNQLAKSIVDQATGEKEKLVKPAAPKKDNKIKDK